MKLQGVHAAAVCQCLDAYTICPFPKNKRSDLRTSGPMRSLEDSSAHQPIGNLRTPPRRLRTRCCHRRRPRASLRSPRRPKRPWCRRRPCRGGGGGGGGGACAPQRRRVGGASELSRSGVAAGVVTPQRPSRPPTPALLRCSCQRRGCSAGSKSGATRGAAGRFAKPRHSTSLPSTSSPPPA